jgi:hypothetical protein
MDPAQEQLFGRGVPRRVGTPNQFWVYSKQHLSDFIDSVTGRKNAYCTISHVNRQMEPVTDKVSLDFDSPEKEKDWGYEEVNRLMDDDSFADDVLGPVCDDVQKMASRTLDDGHGALGVFTGFGVHFHILTKAEVEPNVALASMPQMYKEEEGLEHMDEQPVGDIWRLMRIPNVQRIEDEKATGLWQVPLTRKEMEDITPADLLEYSSRPRRQVACESGVRREMDEYPDYIFSREAVPSEDMEELPMEFSDAAPESVRYMLKEYLQMPCMYERIVQPDPDNIVRHNCAVLLLNVGFSVDEVVDIFSKLNWVDWDRSITREKVEYAHEKGYSDMSCSTAMSKGLCTRLDNPTDCRAYGWSGGKAEWTQ